MCHTHRLDVKNVQGTGFEYDGTWLRVDRPRDLGSCIVVGDDDGDLRLATIKADGVDGRRGRTKKCFGFRCEAEIGLLFSGITPGRGKP